MPPRNADSVNPSLPGMSSLVSAHPIVHRSCPISSDNTSNYSSAILSLARNKTAVPADIHNIQRTGPPDLTRRFFPHETDPLRSDTIFPPHIGQPAVLTDIPDIQRTGPPDLSRRWIPSETHHLHTEAILPPHIGQTAIPTAIPDLQGTGPPDLSRRWLPREPNQLPQLDGNIRNQHNLGHTSD